MEQEQTSPQGFGAPAEPFPQKKATPEQEQQFEKFVGMSMTILFSDKFLERGAKMLKSSEDIIEGMAQIGAAIGTRVYSQAAKEQQEIEPIVVVEGGKVFMDEVRKFAEALGHEVTDEDVEDAYYRAADIMRQALDNAGLLDREAMAAEAEQARQMISEEQMQPFIDRKAKRKEKTMQAMMGGQGS